MKSTVLSIAMIFIGILSISCVQKQQSSFIRTSATESIDVPVDYAIIEIGISNTQKDAVMLDIRDMTNEQAFKKVEEALEQMEEEVV